MFFMSQSEIKYGRRVGIKIYWYMILISVTTINSMNTLTTTDEIQAISSPNYPMNYPSNVELIFIIHSPEGSNVKLSFLDLLLDRRFFDPLIIYDGE